ncbi:MAG: GNAT family N-acetyltransferase, partial [Clostridiaceae bacterium]|nr:GNAT family N-acetyltransferase [Clostridiaceae bacterium]
DVLMRFYYGIGFYVEAIETDRGYLRARMVKEYR